MMGGIGQPNKDNIRTLWEMETYKHLGILKTDVIKLAEIKYILLIITQENEKITQNQTT